VLAETRLGRGKILVASFPVTPNWSNIPLKPEFVPLLLRSVAHVRRPADAEVPNNVKPSQPAPIMIASNWANATVELINPQGKPTIIPMRRSEGGVAGAAVDTLSKGFYTVNISPRGPSTPSQVSLGFSVNLDVDSSNFNRLTQAQLTNTLKPLAFSYIQGSADDPLLTKQLTEKNEVWRTLLWILFAIFGVEFALSTLAPSTARQDSPQTSMRPATGTANVDNARSPVRLSMPKWLMTILGRPHDGGRSA